MVPYICAKIVAEAKKYFYYIPNFLVKKRKYLGDGLELNLKYQEVMMGFHRNEALLFSILFDPLPPIVNYGIPFIFH